MLSSRAVWSWWRIPRVWREFSTGDVCFQLYWAGCWLSSPSGFIKTCRKNTNNKSTQFIRASKFRCEVTSISDPPKESKRSCRNSNLQFAGTGGIKRLKHLNKHSTLHSLKLKVGEWREWKNVYEGWRPMLTRLHKPAHVTAEVRCKADIIIVCKDVVAAAATSVQWLDDPDL